MPHLATGDDGELNSVRLRTQTNAGTETNQGIDAQEDRAIVGYRLMTDGHGVGDDAIGTVELFVGVNPSPGNSEDIGGKLYDEVEYFVDSTNGLVALDGLGVDRFVDTEHYFDWNEDVTLTLNHSVAGASVDHDAKAVVYYVER